MWQRWGGGGVDGWLVRVLQHFKHANIGYVMFEIVKLLVRSTACIKEIIHHLERILWKRSLRLEAV